MQAVGRLTWVLTMILSAALVGVFGGTQMVASASTTGASASYDGGTINLGQGWGSAKVCAVASSGTTCFADQSGYQAWVSAQSAGGIGQISLSNCSTGLKLYSAINYGGSELVLYVQASWINLSTYSFSDVTSSYHVGACAVGMAAGTNGSGAAYPGATSAGSSSTNMGAWNDRVQSVYIS